MCWFLARPCFLGIFLFSRLLVREECNLGSRCLLRWVVGATFIRVGHRRCCVTSRKYQSHSSMSMLPMAGRLYSLDWWTGLDWSGLEWTGLIQISAKCLFQCSPVNKDAPPPPPPPPMAKCLQHLHYSIAVYKYGGGRTGMFGRVCVHRGRQCPTKDLEVRSCNVCPGGGYHTSAIKCRGYY